MVGRIYDKWSQMGLFHKASDATLKPTQNYYERRRSKLTSKKKIHESKISWKKNRLYKKKGTNDRKESTIRNKNYRTVTMRQSKSHQYNSKSKLNCTNTK